MTFFNFSPSNVNSLEHVSVNNQECKTRLKIINVNTNEPVFYPFSIKVNKCSGGFNHPSMTDMLNYVLLILLKTCQSI